MAAAELQHGRLFLGSLLASDKQVPGYPACQKLCEEDLDCVAWTFFTGTPEPYVLADPYVVANTCRRFDIMLVAMKTDYALSALKTGE